jgi:hypothetical protein
MAAMPDWSYQSIFKPLLFALPSDASETLTLNAIGMLARLPGGLHVIDWMGHMQPPPLLRLNAQFPCAVGLGAGFRLDACSLRALSRMGFGFVELGPITIEPVRGHVTRGSDQTILSDDLPISRGLDYFARQFRSKLCDLPLGIRFALLPGTAAAQANDELHALSSRLAAAVDWVCLDSRWSLLNWKEEELLQYFQTAVSLFGRAIVLVEPGLAPRFVQRLVEAGTAAGVAGYLVGGGMRTSDCKRIYGSSCRQPAVQTVRELRQMVTPDTVLTASGGTVQPADALEFFDAGANLVQLYSGLVFSGPGLAKRINEAMLWYRQRPPQPAARPYAASALLRYGWLAFALMGAGLVVTSIAAITVGLTTVILPYDETFVRLQRLAFNSINPHLLGFMQHDRITYAGTSLSTGLFFACLSLFGARRQQRWAYNCVRVAGFFGFASFLLFLGYHYLDPLHAFVTLLLLPFYVWGLACPPPSRSMPSSNLYNDDAWLRAQWGQCLFVFVGAGLIAAGIAICRIGTSSVLIDQDLAYMHTTASALTMHNPHLLPAVAHDRAGFGGALVTIGIAVFMASMHGFRQGEGWFWWTLLISGLPAFIATLAIHYFIGYTNQMHLAPIYIGFAMYACALWLTYPYLCQRRNPDAAPNPQ